MNVVHTKDRKKTTATALRTGSDYLRSLRDGRQVFVDGERVADVTEHPAFREAGRSLAHLFDVAADPALRERMTFISPRTGGPVLRAYQIPRTHADLKARRLFSQTWAEATFGLMGRTPDHVAGFFCGYAATPNIFAAAGREFADNVVSFYERMRDEHIYLSYAIVPPQIDRSKPAHEQSDSTLYAGVVKERDDGIVIKGGQQLATAGVYADYVYVSCIHPLQPGDENYAIEAAEAAGLDEAIAQKDCELALCEEERQRLEREISVLKLLLTTLRNAEHQAKERYLSPVLRRVRPYLQVLFPDADIRINEDLQITGVVREAGYDEPFNHLSMGTQEQIAFLVRLTFAEMLVAWGHPATVILDDALVFSDDRRMQLMFDILNMAAHNVQVLVLTCRERLFEELGGRALSLTTGNSEELLSA